MAKGRAKVSSKQSTGRKRQRELLDSSRCRKHNNLPAVVSLQTGDGKYQHKCSFCYIDTERVTITKVSGASLFHLLTRGK